MGRHRLAHETTPSNPPSGYSTLYFKSDGKLYSLNSSGTEVEIGVSGPPEAHAASHQNGGADEISVAGLSGLLADNQNPTAHASEHVDGTDDIQDATTGQKGLMTATQATKLDGIEAGATTDMTGAEIKAAYEGEANTNAFTDAEKSKVANLISGDNKFDATAAPTANDDSANTSGNGTFSVGSLWTDIVNDEAYRCVDASVGAAVWINTTLSSSELANIAFTGATSDLVGSIVESQIANDAVTFAKLQNISQDRIVGRVSGGSGNAEQLTDANVRSMINVADGADVTGDNPPQAHDIDSASVHNGVSGVSTDEVATFDANGLPQGSNASVTSGEAGGGILNLPTFSTNPSSPSNGDCWLLETGGVRSFNARINGVTFSVELS